VRSVPFALVAAALCTTVATEPASAATVPLGVYVERADAVCLDAAKKAVALRDEALVLVAAADSEAEVRVVFARLYRRQLVLVRGMRLRLVAIGAPRGARAARVAARLVTDIRKGERALSEVIAAVEHGTTAAAEEAVSRYRAVSLASARAVRRSGLGFRYCGAGV
jgi:hypothetical protein